MGRIAWWYTTSLEWHLDAENEHTTLAIRLNFDNGPGTGVRDQASMGLAQQECLTNFATFPAATEYAGSTSGYS